MSLYRTKEVNGRQIRLKKKKKYSKVAAKENRQLLLLMIPATALLLLFNYTPFLGIYMAFVDYNPNLGIWNSPFVGLENFKFFFLSKDAARIIRNTLGYSLVFLAVDLFFAVGLALLFYNLRSRRALKFYNTVVLLPRFLSWVLVAFIVYIVLSPSYGLANGILQAFGGNPVKWYSKAKYWPFILTIVHIWQSVGMNSLFYYSSLMSLDESLIEAAKLDGANKGQQIRYVILPHLVPVMVVIAILAIGKSFSGDFGLFYQVPKDVGMLYETTDIINTYVFRALQNGSFEKSTAIGLFQSLMGLIMIVITNAIVRKISPENSLY